ncbi:MFS transporter (plasmid) [Cupriavidus necator]|uniref:MFS transporter n=1 Tax=Cupriavidus necator TaxID=106590 RepID=A0A367PN04_CUPNE|nr:MFS transporter [Cupriavidus necator]QQX89204.1 MFS transporter [Cupriavidus necator]RCJ08426.1 MFS transporter [Cupriavidus necator]
MSQPSRKPQLLLLTIFLLNGIEFLQTGMIAFASAPIMGEIGAGPEEFSLVSAAYASVAVLAISQQRWFVERLGWRRFLQYSLSIFMIGAVICGSSQAYSEFLLGRLVMALGGASFMTSARIMVNHIHPGPQRFTGIKAFAVALAAGTAAAPWLASVSVANDNWSSIFWIVVGASVVVFVLVTAVFDGESPSSSDSDKSQSHPVLLMLLASGAFLLLYSLQRTYYDFYSDGIPIFLTASVAVVALIYYVSAEHRRETPLIRVRALLNPRYVAGVLLFTCCYVILGADNYVLPALLQRTLGYTWQTVGQFQAMGLASALVSWFILARLLPKYPSPRKFFVIGFGALATFGWLLSGLTPAANLWLDILPALLLNGVFMMFVMANAAIQTFRDVQYDEAVFSHAQQAKNMLAQIGLALGISLATIGQQWRSTVHYDALARNIHPGNPIYLQAVDHLASQVSTVLGQADAGRVAVALVAQSLAQQANLLANLDHFSVIAVIGGLGVVVSLSQRLLK